MRCFKNESENLHRKKLKNDDTIMCVVYLYRVYRLNNGKAEHNQRFKEIGKDKTDSKCHLIIYME